jgi:hypothetical protein
MTHSGPIRGSVLTNEGGPNGLPTVERDGEETTRIESPCPTCGTPGDRRFRSRGHKARSAQRRNPGVPPSILNAPWPLAASNNHAKLPHPHRVRPAP